jgi:lactoylglutathione lyase
MTMTFALHHASLSVRDVNASAEFYARVLGLQEIPNRVGKAYIRWFVIDEFRTLHLIGGDPEAERPRQFSTHLALATPAFGDALAHLERQGIAYVNLAREPGKPHVRQDGIRQIYFQDPDGHWIEINDAVGDP